jgi:hypothetical protein
MPLGMSPSAASRPASAQPGDFANGIGRPLQAGDPIPGGQTPPSRDSVRRVPECRRRLPRSSFGRGSRAIPDQLMCAPWVSTYTEYRLWLPAMNSRLRLAPPKHTLATISGIRISPIRCPSGANTCTPS